MSSFELLQLNILSPVVLAFVLGVVASLLKSDLRIPDEIYKALSIYLLLAIGLKGGVALWATPLYTIALPLALTLLIGAATPLWCYAALRKLGKFSIDDSAAIAAHYGSTSAVTFIAALTFLQAAHQPAEPFLPALLVVLEIPGIVVALVLAKTFSRGDQPIRWGETLHEIMAGRSVILLLGGLVIGFLSGKQGYDQIAPLFETPFRGFLMLFLLEMGLIAARRFKDLKSAGFFLLGFAIVMPVLHGIGGTYLGKLAGLGLGGSVAFGTLCASASYIAAPAAVRIALPKASPAYYLTSSLAVTFPFNLTLGIPLYFAFGKWVFGL